MQQIADWLKKLGMSEYAECFVRNDIDFTILSELTDHDLEKIGVASLGHRRKLLRAIASLEGVPDTSPNGKAVEKAATPNNIAECRQVIGVSNLAFRSLALFLVGYPTSARRDNDEAVKRARHPLAHVAYEHAAASSYMTGHMRDAAIPCRQTRHRHHRSCNHHHAEGASPTSRSTRTQSQTCRGQRSKRPTPVTSISAIRARTVARRSRSEGMNEIAQKSDNAVFVASTELSLENAPRVFQTRASEQQFNDTSSLTRCDELCHNCETVYHYVDRVGF